MKLIILGMKGAQGNCLAHTLDISDHGVRLAGLRCDLKRDDLFELHHKHKHARYRVVWVATREGSSEKYLGGECLEPEKNIWGVDLDDKRDEYEEKDV